MARLETEGVPPAEAGRRLLVNLMADVENQIRARHLVGDTATLMREKNANAQAFFDDAAADAVQAEHWRHFCQQIARRGPRAAAETVEALQIVVFLGNREGYLAFVAAYEATI